MAHKTLVGGTAYNITGGKSMVSGTAYNITGGRTLVGGTGYNISFGQPEVIAMLHSRGGLTFKRGSQVDEGSSIVATYNGFEDVSYSNYADVPWHAQRTNITAIYYDTKMFPISIAYWFYNCTNLNSVNNVSNLILSNITNMAYAYSDCDNLKGSPVCGNNVTNTSQTYYNCENLTGSPICGINVIDMSKMYTRCENLKGPPVCGNNVTNMSQTYFSCLNLTGSPVCGANVIDMSQTYYNCRNLTGSPVCGNNVTNMSKTYYGCTKLTGSPVCGENVTNMSLAYQNCSKLTGSPVCGNNVIYMRNTYRECRKLTGSPVCGKNVTSMYYAYYNCRNLTGSPVCGENVTDIAGTYCNCPNIGNNAYFYSSQISNMTRCFPGKNNSRRLNLYVPSGTTTNTTVHRNNSSSLVGANITWTNAGSYQYNTAYNIYIYPVANVAAAAIANGDEEANANAGISTTCCFAAGTQILTSLNGDTKNIEDIKAGDRVVSYNVNSGENYIAEVQKLVVKENTTDIAEVTLDNGTMVKMNAYHPLYCEDGFHSITLYNGYSELVVGDKVKTVDGWSNIVSINRYASEPIITYNLAIHDIDEDPDIDTFDTYYANGIVVHNIVIECGGLV